MRKHKVVAILKWFVYSNMYRFPYILKPTVIKTIHQTHCVYKTQFIKNKGNISKMYMYFGDYTVSFM